MDFFLKEIKCERFNIMKNMFFIIVLLLFHNEALLSQSFIPQKLPFTKICAGSSFNSFEATFKYSNFPVSTTFEIILSDANGSFANPIVATTLLVTNVSSSEQKILFAVPTTIIGSEICKLRVRSSTGQSSTDFSSFDLKSSFAVYYKSYAEPFFINNHTSNVSICDGGSVSLTIDNPTPEIPSSSPANYPNLKYKWYKNNVLISGETSSSLSVNTLGVYYVEIDYGSCSDVNFRSQNVTVNGTTGSVATITSSLSNPFCLSSGATTLTATAGNSYVWKKDSDVIVGAISQTYSTNESGVYTCDVDFGGCKSTATIDLKGFTIESTIDVPESSPIYEGATITVTATTNAVSPSYKWFRNGFVLPSETAKSYVATSVGEYKVEITQNSGCLISQEIPFTFTSIGDSNAVQIPNLISPNNDGINDYWVIPTEYISGSNTEVVLMDSYGNIIFKTMDYLNNWPENGLDFKSVNPVYYYIITTQSGKVNKGSLTIVK